MGKKRPKKLYVGAFVDIKTRAELQKIAEKNHRTLADEIRKMFSEVIEDKAVK